MTSERALEIVAAYGGDARRWPEDERGAVLALASVDAGVAAAIAEARGLDDVLAAWALDVAPAQFDAAAIVRSAAVRPMRRWFAGGALAAAVAAGVMLWTPMRAPGPEMVLTNSPVQLATAEGDGFGSDADSFGNDAEGFAYVFTPTIDEEDVI